MLLSLNSRIIVHAKNNFNQIKENFLDFQRRNKSSVSYSQAIACTCPFTGFNQPFSPQLDILSLSSGKGNQIFHFVCFWLDFINVIAIIGEFWILIFTLLCILRITVEEFCKRSSFVTIIFIVSFSGSVDTIMVYKTGNHLPQLFWFSGLFFIVDGHFNCVKGLLNS